MVKNGMRPIHPGEILREEFMVPMGLSVHAWARPLGVTPARINDPVRERRGITADTALRLVRYFGTDAQSWINLQAAYDLRVAELASGDYRACREASPGRVKLGITFGPCPNHWKGKS